MLNSAVSASGGGKSRLPPFIAAQLDFLLSHFPLPITLSQFWSGCKNGRYNDRFTLHVPFCLDHVKWDVIYNAHYPEKAPDVIFPLEDAGFQPILVFQQQPDDSALNKWDGKDQGGLLSLIQELRDAYIEYQKQLVANVDDERLKFEMNTMLTRQGIEVCLVFPDNGGTRATRPYEVKIAVPLSDLDINKVVTGCPWVYQQRIYLQAMFPINRGYSSASPEPRLTLLPTPDLKAFMSIDDGDLPHWSDKMCMDEYLLILEDRMRLQVVKAASSIGGRRRFIEALAPVFGRPLEADPVFCRRATVLLSSGMFTFLVHFSIPLNFPDQPPALTMQSSQHFNSKGVPITLDVSYPYSPRWDPREMAERIFEFLIDKSLYFKKFCNDSLMQ